MKKRILSGILCLFLMAGSVRVSAQQWTTNGTNIHNANTGNVGVGITSPAAKFQVIGETRLGASGNYVKVNSSGSLSFVGSSNLVIGDNKYAFKHSGGGNRSLYINKASNRFEFRDSLGNDLMHVDYLNGNGYFSGNLGLGVVSPSAKLEINGQIKITGGSPGAGKVLTSNGSGLATWETPAVGTLTGSGSATRLAFWNGTSSLTSSGNLFWDNTNSNLGIGTGSPLAKLDVSGNIALNNNELRLRTGNDATHFLKFDGTVNGPRLAGWSGGVLSSSSNSIVNDVLRWNDAGLVIITGANNGSLDSNAIKFQTGSGEGIASKRTSGGNQYGLDFYTSGINRLAITGSGNIGIGTTSPAYKLDISGDIHTSGSMISDGFIRSAGSIKSYGGALGLHKDNGNNYKEYNMSINGSNALSLDYTNFVFPATSTTTNLMSIASSGALTLNNPAPTGNSNVDVFKLYTGGVNPAFKINSWNQGNYVELHLKPNNINTVDQGAVFVLGDNNTYMGVEFGEQMQIHSYHGVRITKNAGSSAYPLNVCGTIRSTEVRVEVGTGWCDYVFDKNYKLKTIEELEQYINENKHLPGVLPASEVEKEGLKVGEMNKAMMEKIEELTLYVIQLDKENKELKFEVEKLKGKN